MMSVFSFYKAMSKIDVGTAAGFTFSFVILLVSLTYMVTDTNDEVPNQAWKDLINQSPLHSQLVPKALECLRDHETVSSEVCVNELKNYGMQISEKKQVQTVIDDILALIESSRR